MSLISDAFAITRTLLNDPNVTLWSDARLLAMLPIVYKELWIELSAVESPCVRSQSTPILVSAGMTAFPQPADLRAPWKLYETSATPGSYTEMTEVDFIPLATAKTTTLIYWSWMNEQISLLGSTVDRNVVVQYRKGFTVPTAVGTSIGIDMGELYIGPRVAAIAAGSLANKDAYMVLSDLAKNEMAKVLSLNRGSLK